MPGKKRFYCGFIFLVSVSCSGDDNEKYGGVSPGTELRSLDESEASAFCNANEENLIAAQRGACLRAAILGAGAEVSECQRLNSECLERAPLAVDCSVFSPARLGACEITVGQYQECVEIIASASRSLVCGTPADPPPGCLSLIPAECPLPTPTMTASAKSSMRSSVDTATQSLVVAPCKHSTAMRNASEPIVSTQPALRSW